jgi:hypothetical protein
MADEATNPLVKAAITRIRSVVALIPVLETQEMRDRIEGACADIERAIERHASTRTDGGEA